ncbi:brassinosteroid LRR receptor kinase isoform X1 [Capsella rubella]|uniref:brassinosteroid LRR receptor kinase isoform X1 n=1 Tax=Capsella rubella TaxID=81985 RepID=UPI000CD5C983|nr:brassinosteroid LRR receptor kinase isoform X1 [Capsella rubella]
MELQELKNLTNLEVLGLAQNYLDGPIPEEAICEMKNMRELNLKGNYFGGPLPLCLDNNFTGLFSLNPLTNLTKLKVFKLSSKYDTVKVETESTWQPKFQLSVVVLRFCGLKKIPSFFEYQKNLHLVDLSSNKISGDIPTWLLANNAELEVLQLQNNSFTIFRMPTIVHNLQVLDISANTIDGLFPDDIGRALPNLVHMNGSTNDFQGQFPSSLWEMKNISFLDLSYNNFSGKLPINFFTGCLSLRYLKLSHNKFSGHVLLRGTRFTSMQVLSLDNNLFSGKIGVGLLNSTILLTLDMSNNCLKGAIPSWLSKLSYLTLLLLSNNFLEGTIPHSLVGKSFLEFLDLSGNLLSGSLPSHVHRMFSINLFLHDNNFTGPIPDTLLESVEILDLRNNKLSGSIPQFVNTQDTSILLLRGNNLTGSIPMQLCDLRNMRLLDLSDNKLHGAIPSCLYNVSFGLGGDKEMGIYNTEGYYLDGPKLEFYKSTFFVEKLEEYYTIFHGIEIKFASKRRYDSYSGISQFGHGILGYMYGMDLSRNELSGVIPVELGDLMKLQVLNLSHNFLSSSIPSSFSKLKDIESLDLSYNMLHGSIPQQLTSLNFLAVLDVSYNNLSGIIPQGRHFDTFDEKNYLGNPLLCGPPTKRSCETEKSTEEVGNGGEKGDNEAVIDIVVFCFSTAATCVTVWVCILVLMCFDCPWRRAWLRSVETFIASWKRVLP